MHAKYQGGIIGFSRNYSAYYRWSTTRHRRAQYVEAALQVADMVFEPAQIQGSEASVQNDTEALCSFTNPFEIDTGLDELYWWSSGIPAKPEAATNLLDAVDIGRAAMKDFITDRLINKTAALHDPIRRNKLKTYATSEVSQTVKI